MTVTPHGDDDPFSTKTTVPDASTPIGDELAHDSHLEVVVDQPPATGTPSGTGSPFDTDTGSSAQQTAKHAVSSATDHASDVAGTAKQEASQVASEAKDKAAGLLADAKTQVGEQSSAQLQNLAAKLGELAGELDDMVAGSDSQGTATDLAQQLADKTRQLGSHLESRQPTELLEDVRSFARRRPTAFLAGAAVAGVVAGRLTRGAKAPEPAGTPSAGGPQ